MKKQKELDRLTKELVKQMTGKEVEDTQEADYQISYYYLNKAMDYTHSCTELSDKEQLTLTDVGGSFSQNDMKNFAAKCMILGSNSKDIKELLKGFCDNDN